MKKIFKKFHLPTPIFIGLALCALLVVGLFYTVYITLLNLPKNNEIEPAARYFLNEQYDNGDPLLTKNPELKDMLTGPIITSADPSLGGNTAEITIVEFADFICDYCYKQEAAIRQIIEKHHGTVRLVWKDYPDSNINSLSYQAAVAARCAARQNKFWLYHDLLFAQKGQIENNTFTVLAESVGLDLASFTTCREGLMTKELIDDNIEEANALAIRGVPFIYVNDQEIMGEISSQELENLITLVQLRNN